MFDIFGNVKSLLKIQSVCIDNTVFRLHYQATVIILILFSVLVGSRQYFGDPIDCTSNADTQHVIDNYCWIHSYIERDVEKKDFFSQNDVGEEKERINQHYYQWVGFILFLQSTLFFIPRYLWRYCWEAGKIKALASGIKSPLVDSEKEASGKELLANYLKRNLGNHNSYYFKYIVCEILNLVNVVAQMIFMNRFLDLTNFALYFFNPNNINTPDNKRKDSFSKVYFPKVANCDFTYLSHGGETTFKSLCVLPVNIFNEKIYAFLWIWFALLTVLTIVTLFCRILTFIPFVRAFLLRQTVAAKSMDPKVANFIVNKSTVGDWFLLYGISKNANPFVFGEVLEDLKITINTPLKLNVSINDKHDSEALMDACTAPA